MICNKYSTSFFVIKDQYKTVNIKILDKNLKFQ